VFQLRASLDGRLAGCWQEIQPTEQTADLLEFGSVPVEFLGKMSGKLGAEQHQIVSSVLVRRRRRCSAAIACCRRSVRDHPVLEMAFIEQEHLIEIG
jgi:hypothetical protein